MPCPVCQETSGTSDQSVASPFMTDVTCPRCGQFRLVAPLGQREFQAGGLHESRAHFLSAVLREANDNGAPLTVTSDELDDLLSRVVPARTPLDSIDRILVYLGSRPSRGFFDDYAVNYSHDRSVAAVKDTRDMKYLCDLAAELGLVEDTGHGLRLTVKGWERTDELRRAIPPRSLVFVAMWFDKGLDPAWKDAIRPALEDLGLDARRIDFVEHTDRTDERILLEIAKSRLVVADFTGNRGGVYFEAGYALGRGIPVVWTCKKGYFDRNPLHFDTRQYNHILWENEPDLRERLRVRVEAILSLSRPQGVRNLT